MPQKIHVHTTINGEAVEFLAFGSWQTGTPELLVQWRDTPDGEIREWRRPLP